MDATRPKSDAEDRIADALHKIAESDLRVAEALEALEKASEKSAWGADRYTTYHPHLVYFSSLPNVSSGRASRKATLIFHES